MFRQTLVSRAREMRKEMPLAEVLLWNRLRGDQLGVRFRRQHRVGPYIETDGDTHAERQEYDEKRTYWMNQKGLRVVRFTNEDVITNLDAAVQSIADCCSSAARPSPRSTGEREAGHR
jgi:leucyl-tRNA synthetase